MKKTKGPKAPEAVTDTSATPAAAVPPAAPPAAAPEAPKTTTPRYDAAMAARAAGTLTRAALTENGWVVPL